MELVSALNPSLCFFGIPTTRNIQY
jgi:hypothetical protein